jgi:hypothetical protein
LLHLYINLLKNTREIFVRVNLKESIQALFSIIQEIDPAKFKDIGVNR